MTDAPDRDWDEERWHLCRLDDIPETVAYMRENYYIPDDFAHHIGQKMREDEILFTGGLTLRVAKMEEAYLASLSDRLDYDPERREGDCVEG